MRRNRSSRAAGKKPAAAAQSDSRLNHARRLTFQALEDRCLLTNNPVETPITVHKDDGSIPLATDTTAVLLSGDTIVANSNIGTGPFGKTTGDFDFYKVFVHSDQLLTVESPSINSSLHSIVGVFDSQGNFLEGQDDQQRQQDSYLHFTPTTGGYYYVAVGQYLSGELVSGSVGAAAFPADPTNSLTGPGSYQPTQGPYQVTMTLASETDVAPVAVDDIATTNEGTAVQIPVLANDTDDGVLLPSTWPFKLNRPMAKPRSTPRPASSPTPRMPNFFGTDSFTYKVKDSDGLTSNVATVNVNVNCRWSLLRSPSTTRSACPRTRRKHSNFWPTIPTRTARSCRPVS